MLCTFSAHLSGSIISTARSLIGVLGRTSERNSLKKLIRDQNVLLNPKAAETFAARLQHWGLSPKSHVVFVGTKPFESTKANDDEKMLPVIHLSTEEIDNLRIAHKKMNHSAPFQGFCIGGGIGTIAVGTAATIAGDTVIEGGAIGALMLGVLGCTGIVASACLGANYGYHRLKAQRAIFDPLNVNTLAPFSLGDQLELQRRGTAYHLPAQDLIPALLKKLKPDDRLFMRPKPEASMPADHPYFYMDTGAESRTN